MKRWFCVLLAISMICLGAVKYDLLFSGCNYEYDVTNAKYSRTSAIDLQYSYNYAIIELPNGEVVEGPVDSWRDYEDGDQIQVCIDGVVYLTSTCRCVLMEKYYE